MPNHMTTRNMCGDAQIDLDGIYDELVSMVTGLDELDAVWQRLRAHVLRRTANANRHRLQAASAIADVQEQVSSWNGIERRRTPQDGAAAEIAATVAVAS